MAAIAMTGSGKDSARAHGIERACATRAANVKSRQFDRCPETGALRVALTRGLFALIDDADRDVVAGISWSAHLSSDGRYYARASIGKRRVYLHRYLAAVSGLPEVDHRSGNKLDNRRLNLRPCDRSLNNVNRVYASSGSFRGVYQARPLKSRPGTWVARVTLRGKTRAVGGFNTAEDAARAYDAMAAEIHGEFAVLNFPDRLAEGSR